MKEMGSKLIGHVHVKDNQINPLIASVNGVLDTKPYSEYANRAWTFRTVGYGHSTKFWKDFISTLRLIGYDYVLSIEHEDPLMSPMEGLKKAITFLRQIMLHEKPNKMWWG
jgi:sugar phosphate isomerase/epimerase